MRNEFDGRLEARSHVGRAVFAAFTAAVGGMGPADAVRRACAQLRAAAGEEQPPFALQSLLQRLHAVRREADIPTDGRLELVRGRAGDQYAILVRRGTPWRRQRFTTAHEIGHILLLNHLAAEPHLVAALRAPAAWRDVERLCNYAAAELLVPAADLAERAAAVSFTPAGLRTLADRYLVSMSAILAQGARVVPRSTVTLWRVHARRPGELATLRVVQRFHSGGPFVPLGMTTRHLVPDLVTAAQAHGAAQSSRMVVDTSRRAGILTAVAAGLDLSRRSGEDQLPMFHGRQIPDEGPTEGEVVLWLRASGPPTAADGLWAAWVGPDGWPARASSVDV